MVPSRSKMAVGMRGGILAYRWHQASQLRRHRARTSYRELSQGARGPADGRVALRTDRVDAFQRGVQDVGARKLRPAGCERWGRVVLDGELHGLGIVAARQLRQYLE